MDCIIRKTKSEQCDIRIKYKELLNDEKLTNHKKKSFPEDNLCQGVSRI